MAIVDTFFALLYLSPIHVPFERMSKFFFLRGRAIQHLMAIVDTFFALPYFSLIHVQFEGISNFWESEISIYDHAVCSINTHKPCVHSCERDTYTTSNLSDLKRWPRGVLNQYIGAMCSLI